MEPQKDRITAATRDEQGNTSVPPLADPNADFAQLDPNILHNTQPAFSLEDLARSGLSNQEIMYLRSKGEFIEGDEREAEEYLIAKTREQLPSIDRIDAGPLMQQQVGQMKAYFSGRAPLVQNDGTEVWCQRVPFISPEDRRVGINGYVFFIPKYRRVLLPTEVIFRLEEKAKAERRFDLLSAIYHARQFKPIDQATIPPGQVAAMAMQSINSMPDYLQHQRARMVQELHSEARSRYGIDLAGSVIG